MGSMLASLMGLMVFGLILQFWMHFNEHADQINARVDRQSRSLVVHQLIVRRVSQSRDLAHVKVIERDRRPGFIQQAISDIILFDSVAFYVAKTARTTSDGQAIPALYRKERGGIQQELVPGVYSMAVSAIHHSSLRPELTQLIISVKVCELRSNKNGCSRFTFPLLAKQATHD